MKCSSKFYGDKLSVRFAPEIQISRLCLHGFRCLQGKVQNDEFRQTRVRAICKTNLYAENGTSCVGGEKNQYPFERVHYVLRDSIETRLYDAGGKILVELFARTSFARIDLDLYRNPLLLSLKIVAHWETNQLLRYICSIFTTRNCYDFQIKR